MQADANIEQLSRFRCTECGECCRRHRVPVTDSDLLRLTRATGKRAPEFVEWLAPANVDMTGEPECFVELRQGRRLLVLAMRDGACQFFDGRCKVYSARPASCRTFPLEATLGTSDRVVHLHMLPDAACTGAFDGSPDEPGIAARHRIRTEELAHYAERVAVWNKRQRLRRMLGRLAERDVAFFRFLGSGAT
jgi:Fe-S-cluster containining protein